MKIPYIRVRQRGEIFFVVKLTVKALREKVTFHFREPYASYQEPEKQDKYLEYIEKIKRKGIELKSDDEGIQRRLQLERINSIRDFIMESDANFFANSILLCADVSREEDFEEKYFKLESEEIGYMDIPDSVKFMIIDGQHRLAGLFLAPEEKVDDIELSAGLLFNVSISTAAKLFSDINGKQKPVSRSLLYDLYDQMDQPEIRELKLFHEMCQKFYTDKESPLYRQIKMLGIGSGAISQAFFIEYCRDAIKTAELDINQLQNCYSQLFYYFKAFQSVFPDDWPVPENFKEKDELKKINELEKHAALVLKERRSQLVKTNGFGAILRVFPCVYTASGGTYKGYREQVLKLVGKISWRPQPGEAYGTGKAFQNHLVSIMESILF
jgi:DGQHR domain-containing protein